MAGMVTSGGKYGNTALQALNPVWYAQSKIKRREYDAALEICTALLERNPYDQVGSSSHRWLGFNMRGARVWLLIGGGSRAGRMVSEVPRADTEELDR